MENIDLIDTFSEFKELKSIDRATMMSVLEDVFRSMLMRMYGTSDNFDIIINIPTREKIKTGKEFTDGKLIRKGAVEMGIRLITDVEVAVMVIRSLGKQKKYET